MMTCTDLYAVHVSGYDSPGDLAMDMALDLMCVPAALRGKRCTFCQASFDQDPHHFSSCSYGALVPGSLHDPIVKVIFQMTKTVFSATRITADLGNRANNIHTPMANQYSPNHVPDVTVHGGNPIIMEIRTTTAEARSNREAGCTPFQLHEDKANEVARVYGHSLRPRGYRGNLFAVTVDTRGSLGRGSHHLHGSQQLLQHLHSVYSDDPYDMLDDAGDLFALQGRTRFSFRDYWAKRISWITRKSLIAWYRRAGGISSRHWDPPPRPPTTAPRATGRRRQSLRNM